MGAGGGRRDGRWGGGGGGGSGQGQGAGRGGLGGSARLPRGRDPHPRGQHPGPRDTHHPQTTAQARAQDPESATHLPMTRQPFPRVQPHISKLPHSPDPAPDVYGLTPAPCPPGGVSIPPARDAPRLGVSTPVRRNRAESVRRLDRHFLPQPGRNHPGNRVASRLRIGNLRHDRRRRSSRSRLGRRRHRHRQRQQNSGHDGKYQRGFHR